MHEKKNFLNFKEIREKIKQNHHHFIKIKKKIVQRKYFKWMDHVIN